MIDGEVSAGFCLFRFAHLRRRRLQDDSVWSDFRVHFRLELHDPGLSVFFNTLANLSLKFMETLSGKVPNCEKLLGDKGWLTGDRELTRIEEIHGIEGVQHNFLPSTEHTLAW
ncbi:hypothetical protein TcWFU_008867 [Taenia crassiceps]|uniref:Uncharacterized protein n=1 Tax=Taenia crassiceps TaxID=6207 RepID=A0ABR4Q6J7_9CEST